MSHVPETLRSELETRYDIQRELGRGGMGVVFLAHDLKHDRRVALKVMNQETASGLDTKRFLSEIKVAARLEHPHIVPLHDSGEVGGRPYYVMQFVDGESLQERLRRDRVLSLSDAVLVLDDVADGLAAAHVQGIVHRDVKPAN